MCLYVAVTEALKVKDICSHPLINRWNGSGAPLAGAVHSQIQKVRGSLPPSIGD